MASISAPKMSNLCLYMYKYNDELNHRYQRRQDSLCHLVQRTQQEQC